MQFEIVIRDADKIFHFVFFRRLYDLTRVKRGLDPFISSFRNCVPSHGQAQEKQKADRDFIHS